ncbi:MAG: efflux transporter outer membrane subunit [Novosphingobium sp.]
MIRKRAVTCLALGAVLAGCTMAPRYARPDPAIPPAWPSGDAYLRESEAALPSYDWRTVMADARLRAVIEQALAANQDLKLATANIAAARAQFDVQKAELLPTVNFNAGLSRSDNGGGPSSSADAQVGVTGYEIELFGRVRSMNDAAKGRYFASVSAARAARLTLIADVADAWLNLGADLSLLDLARQTQAAAGESYRLASARYTGGVAPRTDMRQAEQVLRTAEADVANQTTLVAQDRNALRLLVGTDVDPANLPGSIADAASGISDVPAGLSSEILLRRPDVVEAEWQLRAANAQIGAARAALFPRISLTGLLGLVSPGLSGLFSGGSFVWQGGAAANYPIFSGGAGKANVRLSEAQRDAALAGYQKAIQTAFADVANALARRGTITAQTRAVEAGDAAAEDNLSLADARYRGGIDSYLQDLTARVARYNAARSLIQTRLLSATNRVSLYRALGGDQSI